MARYTFVVFSDPMEGRDHEYNEWYSNQHIADVLKIPGFVAAQRFRLAETVPAQVFSHGYLALYEVETDDLAETRQTLSAAAGTPAMMLSDALDRDGIVARYFMPIDKRAVVPSPDAARPSETAAEVE